MSTGRLPSSSPLLLAPCGSTSQGRPRAGQGALLIVTGAAPLAAMMFKSGRRTGRPVTRARGVPGRDGRADGLLGRLHRDEAAGQLDRRLLHVHLPRARATSGLGSGILIGLCYVIFAAGVTGALGYFASTSIDEWFGSLPGYV